jgi:hypothetical protein
MKKRIGVSSVIAIASGTLCWYLLSHLQLGGADFNWAFQAANNLLVKRDPYASTPSGAVPYPLFAALVALPFVWMSRAAAAGAFFGLSSGLLALGLTRQGYTGLLVFFAYPYWAALITAQWSPLIMASALFSFLLPLAMTKPQIGLPVGLTHLSRRGLMACLAAAGISFLIMPAWMVRWLPQLRGYQHFFPLAVLPGPLLLLALLRHRERSARLLLLTAAMPQRWFYDAFILWLIPKSRREIVWTVAASWVVGVWRWYHMPRSFTQVGRWTVLFIYLPMLVVVLSRGSENETHRLPLGVKRNCCGARAWLALAARGCDSVQSERRDL